MKPQLLKLVRGLKQRCWRCRMTERKKEILAYIVGVVETKINADIAGIAADSFMTVTPAAIVNVRSTDSMAKTIDKARQTDLMDREHEEDKSETGEPSSLRS